MTQVATAQSNAIATKQLFAREDVASKFKEMLGKRAPQFITSVLQIMNSNTMLAKADPMSIYNCAVLAATLDLPLNNSLGFAYIVPYGNQATFQLGYRAFIQLAQRSGQFLTISASPIYEGQLISENPLTGYQFDFTKKASEKVIGYASYFKLLNGFEKTLYMTVEELKKHGKKFSQTFKKGTGLWVDDFDSMCIKTVIKLLLSKFAPLSVEMQRAVITDQSIINNEDATDVTYIDNQEPEIEIDHEKERILAMIDDCTAIEDLEALKIECITDELLLAYHAKEGRLKKEPK